MSTNAFSTRAKIRRYGMGWLGAAICLAALIGQAAAQEVTEAMLPVQDAMSPLPAGAIHFKGYWENDIQNSIAHWNKGVVPYAGLVRMFRTGRSFFAQGEMWGKAVRSGCMFYRYTGDPELKKILKATVTDLLTTQRSNGSISCVPVEKQPDSAGGELWERKYVLLGLEDYYRNVDRDPAVMKAMVDLADCTLVQVGPPPKAGILDLGWSSNHIESSSILEPMMRLYRWTGDKRYLNFSKYIVDQGGAKNYHIINDACAGKDPEQMGGIYPKAYEMMSLFEGLVDYYRATGDEHARKAVLQLYDKIRRLEITLIGNGGGDEPNHPDMGGEGWDYTAYEQTHPEIRRMMETCVGVTWLKYCSQILRLTGDPSCVDEIEKYGCNGLIGALKPGGDGFSFVNLLNGVKTNPQGWGGTIDGVYVTCCNLNGPMGLAYLPYVAVMNSPSGPVVNLYNAAVAEAATPSGQTVRLTIDSHYPLSGEVKIGVELARPEKFLVRLRIPAWSSRTKLTVNGQEIAAQAGTYAELHRQWSSGDRIELELDMRCRIVDSPRTQDRRQALIRGPVVLARDENLDAAFDKPVAILSKDGYVDVTPVPPTLPTARMQFRVPLADGGSILMVDYASVDSWSGKRICTWLPKPPSDSAPAKP